MTDRRGSLEGWGKGERERVWWKRGYDPIGRHTMAATVLGVLIAALIGATLDPFNLRTADDLKRAELAAHEAAYAAVQAEGYADGVPYGEVQHLGEEIIEQGAGAGSAYGHQFEIGWKQGWNDALDAMLGAAEELGLPSDYTEFRVLEEIERR